MNDDPYETIAAELQTLFEQVDAVPPLISQAANAALTWRRIDAELAELLGDSADQTESLAAARGPDAPIRAVTMSSGELSIDIQILADGPPRTVLGQLSPPASATIEIQTIDGESATTESDRSGRYFSNTFSICPTFFCTLPAIFSSWPSAARLGLLVICPAFSFALPLIS